MQTTLLLSYISDSERLIRLAADAINSFFISDADLTVDTPGFIGFMRDSLTRERNFLMTTGGGAVTSNLYKVDQYLPYLMTNKALGIKRVIENRDRSRDYIMTQAPEIDFASSPSFRTLSPLTYSVYASIANRSSRNDANEFHHRAAFFNTINLFHFCKPKWPSYQNVDRAHPFIAYKVQGAAISLLHDRAAADRAFSMASGRLEPSMLGMGPENDHFTEFQERLNGAMKALRTIPDKSRFLSFINESQKDYQEKSGHYLLEQIGYAPDGTSDSSQPLLYDPVGSCFALQILLLTFRDQDGRYDLQAFFGKYSTLVYQTIEHVLASLSDLGSFPYGAPFSYKPNGTVGFSTSINGVSALSHFLLKILINARRADYPSRKFLTTLFEDNQQGLQKLFSLLSLFVSTIRLFSIESDECDYLRETRNLKGWSTDRAFNQSRIESWVTIEVLLFAIYSREVLQELLQFQVADKFGASMQFDQPRWPYKGFPDVTNSKPTSEAEPILVDPDGLVPLSTGDTFTFDPALSTSAPVQFLHSQFYKFMVDENAFAGWQQDVSSILLFGPPGTAKSTMIRSLAQQLHWHFLELSPGDFIIKGLEGIEEKAKDLFQDLSSLRETVILFDELDSLFVDREFLPPESVINFIVPALLPKLQSLNKRAKNQRLLIVIATNFYDRLDPAMVRLGRMDKHLVVLPHNANSRWNIINSLLTVPVTEENNPTLWRKIIEFPSIFVFEELQLIARQIESGILVDEIVVPPTSIGPSWYSSRLPRRKKRRRRVRGTARLAVEIGELTRRILNKERFLTPNDVREKIIKELETSAHELRERDEADWHELCLEVIESLSGRNGGDITS